MACDVKTAVCTAFMYSHARLVNILFGIEKALIFKINLTLACFSNDSE